VNRPKVSFGLATYNSLPYLTHALDSILGMNVPYEYEVVVADDGSDDDSLRVLSEYAPRFEGRLRVLSGDRNPILHVGSGFRVDRNKLRLMLSLRGEYCLCGDGDDYWCDADFVVDAIRILEGDAKLSAVIHDYGCVGDTEVQPAPLDLPEGPLPSWVYISRHYSHYGTFVFRNLVPLHYPSLCVIGADDVPLQQWLATVGDFYYRRKKVYAYRQYGQGGWLKTNPHVANLYELSFVWRALPHLSGRMRQAFLAIRLRFLQSCFANRKDMWKTFRGLESGHCIACDFGLASPMKTLCHWDVASFWQRSAVTLWLLGLMATSRFYAHVLKRKARRLERGAR